MEPPTATGREQFRAAAHVHALAKDYAARARSGEFLMQLSDLKAVELLLWTRLWSKEHKAFVNQVWQDKPEVRRHLVTIALAAHSHYPSGKRMDWVFREMFGSSAAFKKAIASTIADPSCDEDQKDFLGSLGRQRTFEPSGDQTRAST